MKEGEYIRIFACDNDTIIQVYFQAVESQEKPNIFQLGMFEPEVMEVTGVNYTFNNYAGRCRELSSSSIEYHYPIGALVIQALRKYISQNQNNPGLQKELKEAKQIMDCLAQGTNLKYYYYDIKAELINDFPKNLNDTIYTSVLMAYPKIPYKVMVYGITDDVYREMGTLLDLGLVFMDSEVVAFECDNLENAEKILTAIITSIDGLPAKYEADGVQRTHHFKKVYNSLSKFNPSRSDKEPYVVYFAVCPDTNPTGDGDCP